MEYINSVDKTIDQICDWIQKELKERDGYDVNNEVSNMINALANLITARAHTESENEEEKMIIINCECGRDMHGSDAIYCGGCGKKLERAVCDNSL